MAFIKGMYAKMSECGNWNGVHRRDERQNERVRLTQWRSSRE
ncbi:hypothetical protein PU629_14605 [Pullulanibacillus sp. KACC 23026]|nr:hypothetical protein [Pullulanibacillus sp. KACC 23026]WEG11389.1 hypothetical protein PU629_14605 [Pullulanibacillus sp. KACC 23026]